MTSFDLAALRRDYALSSLSETDVDPDPIHQFERWFADAVSAQVLEPNAMTPATASRDGVPADADWVFDARMLPNPHYDPLLRPLTGRDEAVAQALGRDEAVQRWLEDVRRLLGRWVPEIMRENRTHVTVAVGCTGGRHRSVYLAEQLAETFRKDWRVLVRHRNLAKADAR
jgi:UPF0042 nucleotide-binding protein